MRRWIWRVLLIAAAVLALAGTALAAPGDADEIWVNGVQLELNAAETEWTVIGYDGETEEVVIPALHKNKPVTKIGASVFSNVAGAKTELKKVTIPGTVTSVGDNAFKDCISLNTVTFQDYMSVEGSGRNATIGEGAFYGCNGLTTVTLSSNITEIMKDAFRGCTRLTSVVIPKGVNTITAGAFGGCNLEDVTFLDNATNAVGAFNFDQLTTIHCLKTSTMYKNLSSKYPDKVHVITVSEDKVTKIASCQQEGEIQNSFTCTYKLEIKEDIKDADGNKTGEKVVDTKYCERFGNTAHTENRTTSILPHTEGMPSSKDSTCVEHGYEDKIDCTVCGTELSSTELELIDHDYGEDAEVKEESLFPGQCGRKATDTNTAVREETLGLSMVTKKCSVCGYTPVCWECEELKLALEEADAGLEEAQKTLAEAAAKLETAKAAKEKAKAANTAAGEALTAAEKAQREAQNAYREAQDRTAAAKTALEALGDTATDEEKEAAQKALEEAEAKEEEAKRTALAADRAVLERKIAKDEAEAEQTEAQTAYSTAEGEKTTAENAVKNNTAVSTAQGNLRTHLADINKGGHGECAECLDLLEAIRSAKSESAKKKAKDVYAAHQSDNNAHKPVNIPEGAISGKESDKAPEHDWGEPEVPDNVKRPVCGSGESIIMTPKYTCRVCGETKDGKAEILDAAPEHKLPAKPEIESETAATCTQDGKIVYKDYTCEICETEVKGEERTISATGHHWVDRPDLDKVVKEPNCVDGGLKNTYQVCDNENCPLKGEPQLKEENVPINPNPEGHKWGNFKVTEGTEKQEHPCQEGTAMGTATCTVCGHSSGTIEIVLPATEPHTWGAWTASEDGKTETRTCTVCGEKDERAVTVPDNPDDPDDPDNPDNPDEPDKPDPDASYTITLVQGTGGRVTASRSSAKAGTTVTITVTPESGYELDMVRVIGDTTAEDLTGGRRSFTMPASNVKVQASFARIASGAGWGGVSSSSGRTDPARTQELLPMQITSPASTPWAGTGNQLYWDIPTSHWAAGEINWANQMGYMSGSGGRFDPDGTITGQQVWMVMARLMGTYPASMAEARRWAVETGFATGSSPERAMTRHQVVTALYRCAILRGRASRPSGLTLAGYADSSLVPAVARDAMIWAVSNGIVTGDSSNRLNPTGTITRAQFAVLLYRFSQRV